TLAPGANARDRDQSRRKTFAERHASAVAGEATNSITARSSVEHSGRKRDRGTVAGKNRACSAWTPQPGLQYACTRVGDGTRFHGEVRQARYGNPLRHAIRNQSPISNRRHRPRPVSADVRERLFPKRAIAAAMRARERRLPACRSGQLAKTGNGVTRELRV